VLLYPFTAVPPSTC